MGKLKENEFLCMSCRTATNKACHKKGTNIRGSTQQTLHGKRYVLLADCASCSHKMRKYTNEALYNKYK